MVPSKTVGTILHKYLIDFGVRPKEGCDCERHMEQMDLWGPEGCRENLHTILKWLRIEAHKRRFPFSQTLAKQLVLFCIRKSEETT